VTNHGCDQILVTNIFLPNSGTTPAVVVLSTLFFINQSSIELTMIIGIIYVLVRDQAGLAWLPKSIGYMEGKMPHKQIPPEPLLDRKSAAKYLGYAPGTLAVWDCIKRYDLKPIKIGRSVRYRKSDLDKFLEERLRA